ncbi:MAG: ATP-binding cassette domain-containing protein, partial [Rhizorhabdus sp.]
PISDLLSQGLISSLVDGIMAILTLVLMFVYSTSLSIISIVALVIVTCLRVGFFSALRHANVNMVTATARENSVFIESLRGISTIKAFGEESNRQRYWQQKKADAVNAEIKAGRLNAGFNAGEQFVMGLERVVFVYLAVRYAMTGALSVGMIFALQSYRQQFLDATNRLIQQGISYRLLDMHLSRIADIALSEPEIVTSVEANLTNEGVPARVTLRKVRFRYAANEPEILCGIDLDIEPGEMVALIGGSGNGKTTLMKVMMGLLPPTSGEVLINGVPVAAYGLLRWRREIASVAQDDALFAGSLADNICMFDPEPDNERMVRAVEASSIKEEIERMPMRYHTPVGDMGSVLSGGQKQRVMLARAMYRQPTALFLDEATAHLDSESEFKVGEAVRRMPCTRVVIAHRPQTIKRADRVFIVSGGMLRQVEPDAKHQTSIA